MRIQRVFFGRGVLLAISSMVLVVAGSRVMVQKAAAQSASPRSAVAQKRIGARITQAIDETNRVSLRGNVHPLARAEFDRGAVADSQPITRILLLLQRSPEQETALTQLMNEQVTKDSTNFHAWLTPEQFGKQFGPADADIQTVTNWLTSHGLQVSKLTKGRIAIEFSGTAAQVQRAFATEIHKFNVKGEDHFANISEPSIPAALAPVVRGVKALHTFRPKPFLRRVGTFRKNMQTGQVKPAFTFNDVNGTFYGVGPADFAAIYGINTTAQTGGGQSIAIVGQSNINLQDVCDFRAMFGLPAYQITSPPNAAPSCSAGSGPQLSVILNGEDPGLVPGDETESDLDVEWSGAVAPQAQIFFVTTETTITDFTFGVDASAIYVIDNNVAPVMSESYGACEAALGSGGNAFYNSLWQQAAAEGITVSVSAGDDGSAGCDDTSEQSAVNGTAVSGFASTPFNVAVGGTDFDQAGNQPAFWSANNTSGTQASAQGYIPEVPWNDSCAATGITGCASATSSSQNLNIVAGSGGPSNCATSSGSPPPPLGQGTGIACGGATPKPSWQTGLTPADNARDLPDISLFAADGLNASFYIICESDAIIPGDTNCNLTTFTSTSPFHDFLGVGGTSAGAPAFAGIMALLNQAKGGRQGNANPALYHTYSLAKTAGTVCASAASPAANCVFYDVAKGNISVACTAGAASSLFGTASLDCSNKTTSGFGAMATSTGGTTPAYAASAGYDYATGLGTLNVTNLLALWTSPARTASAATLSLSPTSITVDQQVTVSGTVTPNTATGIVTLFEGSTSGRVIDRFAVSGGSYGGATNGLTTFFPGGGGLTSNTYSVIAHYGGDGANAPSDSAPTPIAVAPQPSNTVVSFVTFDPSGNPILNTGSLSVPYGSAYILRIDVEPTTGNFAGQKCQSLSTGAILFACPTGTVTLTANGSPLNDLPNGQNVGASNKANLNDRGFAEDQPIQLAASATPYSIAAAYSGDSSYNPSTSAATNVTINKAPTTTTLGSSVSSITAGGSVTLTATVNSGSNGETLCGAGVTNPGTVQFMNGSTALTGTVTYTGVPPNFTTGAGASCTAVLSTTLSMLMPPTAPRNIRLFRWMLTWIVAVLLLILFLLSRRVLPAPKRRYGYAGLVLFACIAAGFAGCSSSNGGGGGGGGAHTDSITASYSGDANYASSTSAAVTISVH
jgi:hypothetical protein